MEAPLTLPKSHLRLAGTRGLSGTALFVVGAGLAIHQLARSNRPHELTRAPLVAGIALVAMVFLVLTLRHLWVHLTSDEPRKAWAFVLLPVALSVTLMDAWLLVGAAATIPDVLAG